MSAESWRPDDAVMGRLLALLGLGQRPEAAAQTEVRTGLEQLSSVALYSAYLAAVLGSDQIDHYRRQLAGLVLKNHVERSWGTLSLAEQALVKQRVPPALGDGHAPVRRTGAQICCAVARKEEGFQRWPGLLEGIAGALQQDHSSPHFEGALYALELLAEDCTRELQDHPGRPLNALIPALIRVLHSSSAGQSEQQVQAMRALSAFVVDFPAALKINAQPFLQAVFAAAQSSPLHPAMARQLCRCFNTLCDV